MAYVGGYTTGSNLQGLDCLFCHATILRGCQSSNQDNLANYFSSQSWNSVFGNNGGNPNDGIVSVTSQANGDIPALVLGGYVHSSGLVQGLDFIGPSLLDGGAIATCVVDLLNEPKTGSDFTH